MKGSDGGGDPNKRIGMLKNMVRDLDFPMDKLHVIARVWSILTSAVNAFCIINGRPERKGFDHRIKLVSKTLEFCSRKSHSEHGLLNCWLRNIPTIRFVQVCKNKIETIKPVEDAQLKEFRAALSSAQQRFEFVPQEPNIGQLADSFTSTVSM